MAEINKLSPEKALKKLRKSDTQNSPDARLDEKNAELDEEIRRMREQRLRLERRQKKRDWAVVEFDAIRFARCPLSVHLPNNFWLAPSRLREIARARSSFFASLFALEIAHWKAPLEGEGDRVTARVFGRSQGNRTASSIETALAVAA
jgi:hypothetical protein